MSAKPKSESFKFDTVFGEDGEIVRAAPRPRAKTQFTAEEVEAIRQDAFAQGAQNDEAAAQNALAQALQHAAAAAQRLLKRHGEKLSEIRAEASGLALAAARKVAGHALANYPLAEIEKMTAGALHQYHDEARLVLRLAPELAGPMQTRLPALIEAEGFTGRVLVVGEPSLHGANVRLEWADGGVERDAGKIFAKMETEIERWHAAERAQSRPDTGLTERDE